MKRTISFFVLFGAVVGITFAVFAPSPSFADYHNFPSPKEDLKIDPTSGPQKAVLAGGCFWCTQGVFENTPGVTKVVAGYAGGSQSSADYETVSSGTTGHAESIEITYDPAKTTYGKLLKQFFSIAHDPTTLDAQGPDEGKQYRSVIFFADDAQKHVAQAYIKQLIDAKVFDKPIVTTLEPLKGFYPAEAYHQEYVKSHPDSLYIITNALPKIEKAKRAAAEENGAPPATNPSAPATEPAR